MERRALSRSTGVLLCAVLALFAAPALLLLAGAFLRPGAAEDAGLWEKLASGLSFEQFRLAFENGSLVRMLKNSLLITLPSLAAHLPISFFAGVFLARPRARLRAGASAFYALALLMPFQVIMLPVYQMSVGAGVLDSPLSVIALMAFSPIGPILIAILVRSVPSACWEAALLETSSVSRVLFGVLLPQLLPGIGVLALLIFAEAWNVVEQPLILLPTFARQPLSLAYNDFLRAQSPYAYAGGVIYALPACCIYLFCASLAGKRLRG